MRFSLNEIEALSKRATRGAGLSWGMAEEAGRAARWLASHGVPGPAALCGLLTQNDGVSPAQCAPRIGNSGDAWRAASGAMCPLAAGAALNDHAERLRDGRPIEMVDVSYPVLVVPFAAWAALHIKEPVRVNWQGLEIHTDGDGIVINGPPAGLDASKAKTVTCQSGSIDPDALQGPGTRGTVATKVWACLNDFAARTYAPATEASRILGAGAGASDND